MKRLHTTFNNVARRTTAGILLIALSPVFVAASIAVYRDVGAPIIYKQKRYGQNKKEFEIYKFRTMRIAQENEKSQAFDYKRVTKVGQWLRRTGLDEFPQLFNIIKGDMHFTGPRPIPHQIPKRYDDIYQYKPGLFAPKSATGYRRIAPEQDDYLERLEKGFQIDMNGMKNMSLLNKIDLIYRTLAENIKKDHTGSEPPINNKSTYGSDYPQPPEPPL